MVCRDQISRMTVEPDATGWHSTAYAPTFIEDCGDDPGAVEALRDQQAGKSSSDDGDCWGMGVFRNRRALTLIGVDV